MGVLSRFTKSSPSSVLTAPDKEAQVLAPMSGDAQHYDDSPFPLATWRTIVMGILVSMGGIIFGYDTGQISGFLEMEDFLQRFGEIGPDPMDPAGPEIHRFTNIRSGLIVGMVCLSSMRQWVGAQDANAWFSSLLGR